MKVETALAPSISAASFCSSSSDCTAVSKISLANGSHCHDTIRITASSGASVNQSIGVLPNSDAIQTNSPNSDAIQANSPHTGCINRFFQTKALTVGMTKSGAITILCTMLRPANGW